jgi:hypothetical protein
VARSGARGTRANLAQRFPVSSPARGDDRHDHHSLSAIDQQSAVLEKGVARRKYAAERVDAYTGAVLGNVTWARNHRYRRHPARAGITRIQPALAMGMRGMRVAIEEPPPASSAAHAVVSSLAQARSTLAAWTPGGIRQDDRSDYMLG